LGSQPGSAAVAARVVRGAGQRSERAIALAREARDGVGAGRVVVDIDVAVRMRGVGGRERGRRGGGGEREQAGEDSSRELPCELLHDVLS
jgi:hypothetical protein